MSCFDGKMLTATLLHWYLNSHSRVEMNCDLSLFFRPKQNLLFSSELEISLGLNILHMSWHFRQTFCWSNTLLNQFSMTIFRESEALFNRKTTSVDQSKESWGRETKMISWLLFRSNEIMACHCGLVLKKDQFSNHIHRGVCWFRFPSFIRFASKFSRTAKMNHLWYNFSSPR
jgi:hypothetical protein